MTALPALLIACGVSTVGTRMSFVALPWFVLVSTGSATRTGLVAFAELLPYVASTVLAAPLVDRTGTRRASIACDLVSATAVCAIPVLHELDLLSFGALLALVALLGCFRGPGDNAKLTLLPAAARTDGTELGRATSLFDAVQRTCALIGPPLAGALVGVLGAPLVLLADGATFLAAAGVLSVSRRAEAGYAPASPAESYARRVLSGVDFLRNDPLLFAMARMVLLTNLLDTAYVTTVLPLWVRSHGRDALWVGLLMGTFSGGAAVGAFAMVGLAHRLPRRAAFLAAFALAGCPRFFALGADVPVSLVFGIVAAGGLAAGVINPIMAAVTMERIPDDLRARVLAASTAIAFAGLPLGGLLGGQLIAAVGLRPTLLTAGGVYLAACLLPLRPAWRDMDRSAELRPPPPRPGSVPEEPLVP